MNDPPRLGSLCSGYGGLDLAALAVFGGEPVWHAELDPDAAKVLAYRFPGVPNLGDITALDWSAVPPVDVLTAGYPCQPFSTAGQRKGEGDKRHLWPHIAEAVRVLRPRLVFLENVAGHLSLGFGTVLGQLAALGLDAEWLVCKASDLGAAHERARLFVLAWPAHAPRLRRRQGPVPAHPPGEPGQPGHPPGPAAANPACLGEREPANPDHPEPGRRETRPLPRGGSLLPTPRATDGEKGGPNARNSDGSPKLPAAVQPAHWGRYAPAIARHEHLTGRPAPHPTEPGPNGPRLSPRFTEWLMCLPNGWVTAVPGVSRGAQLRILGNGVIPPHAEAGIATLVERSD